MVKALSRWETIRYTFNDVLEQKYMYMYVICRNLQYTYMYNYKANCNTQYVSVHT